MRRVRGLALLSVALSSQPALVACSGDDNASPVPAVMEGGVVGDARMPVDATMAGDSEAAAPHANPGDGDASGAAPPCTTLPGSVIYIESGDTQEPLLKALGRKLRDSANIPLAFQLTGSCTLSPNLYQGTPIPKNTNMFYIPSSAEYPSWKSSDPEMTCTADPGGGTVPNLGISALFPSRCAGVGSPPAGTGSFIGPIQAYTFIVRNAEFAAQSAVSASEAAGARARSPQSCGGQRKSDQGRPAGPRIGLRANGLDRSQSAVARRDQRIHRPAAKRRPVHLATRTRPARRGRPRFRRP